MSTLTIPSDLYSTDPGTVSGKERYENMWKICITLSLCAFVWFSRVRESARTFGFPARQVQMGGLRWRLWALSWKTFFVVPRFCQNVPKAMPLSDVKTKSFK